MAPQNTALYEKLRGSVGNACKDSLSWRPHTEKYHNLIETILSEDIVARNVKWWNRDKLAADEAASWLGHFFEGYQEDLDLLYDIDDMATHGDLVVAVSGGSGLIVLVDISDPARPQVVDTTNVLEEYGWRPTAVAASHGRMLFAGDDDKLHIVDAESLPDYGAASQMTFQGEVVDIAADGKVVAVIAGSVVHILDTSNPENPVSLGFIEAAGRVMNVAVSAGRVVFADVPTAELGHSILRVFEVHGGQIAELGVVGGSACPRGEPSRMYAAATGGKQVACVSGHNGLYVFDTESGDSSASGVLYLPSARRGAAEVPDGVHFVDEIGQLGGSSFAVATSDRNVLLGVGPRIVLLSAVGDGTPQIVGESEPLPDVAYDVVVEDGHAYVAAGRAGLVVVEIANAAQPRTLAVADTPGRALRVALHDGLAFVADESSVRIFNVGDPAHPLELGHIEIGGAAVAAAAGRLFVADGVSGMYSFDVSNPENPIEISGVQTTGFPSDVAVHGGHAFVADGAGGFLVVDVSQATEMSLAATLALGEDAMRLFLHGDTAYVAGSDGGLTVVDIGAPEAPRLLSNRSDVGYVHALTFRGDVAYVANGTSGGLSVLDIEHRVAPEQTAHLDTLGHSRGVAVDHGVAYVAAGQELAVVTAQERSGITLLGSVATAGGTHSVAVDGPLAVAIDNRDAATAFDVSQAENPIRVGEYQLAEASNSTKVALKDSVAYIAFRDEGIISVDFADPGSPRLLESAFRPPGGAYDVALSEEYAFVANGSWGIVSHRVSNPAQALVGDVLSVSDAAFGIDLYGRLAYVAAGMGGLRVVDVSNPIALLETCGTNQIGEAYSVAATGHLVFVGTLRGLAIVEASCRPTPAPVTWFATETPILDVAAEGDLVLVAAGDAGIYALRMRRE